LDYVLSHAKEALIAARKKGILVIYIRIGFTPGYPEAGLKNKSFVAAKGTGRFVLGNPGTDMHPEVAPEPSDLIVNKTRVGAFSSTNLDVILRGNNINDIVVFGLSTSGVVLSTVRDAFDKDYNIIVLSDACADRVPEVHDVLIKHVISKQATVVTVKEWVESLNKK